MPTPRPTLRDVARLAGVSHVTVSRAVRGSQAVAPETARRVKEAVERLGYRPDPVLSSLAAYRSALRPRTRTGNVLAFLDRDGSAYSRVVRGGAEREAARLGYRVEGFILGRSEAAQRRLGRQLYHRGVHGLLFGPSDRAWELKGWQWDRFAAVSLGALQHTPALHAVAMDYFQGAFDGGEVLWKAGCRRVGLAMEGWMETRSGHRWLGGYEAWLRTRGGAFLHFGGRPDRTALRAWSRQHRIDGVLTISSGVGAALESTGVRVLFLNALDCPPGAPHFALDPEEIGVEGVRLLHPMLLQREFGLPRQPKMTALQAILKDGESAI